MSYGLAYGLSAYGLAQQLRITPEEAREQMHAYFERFGGIRDYLDGVVDEARQTGFTETTLGRRRYLPDLTSDNRQRREMAERMALNAPIQGSAADIIKVAMLKVESALRTGDLKSRMLLQVHDELVLELAPGEREQVEALVRREMAAAAELSVELDVSVGYGRSWDDAAHEGRTTPVHGPLGPTDLLPAAHRAERRRQCASRSARPTRYRRRPGGF
jgi:DNA polymerase-1